MSKEELDELLVRVGLDPYEDETAAQLSSEIYMLTVKALREQLEEIERVNDDVESCEPDCDDVRHARHTGAYEHCLAVDNVIKQMKDKL